MELFVFAKFHAHAGLEGPLLKALLTVSAATRKEQGCLAHQVFRSNRDPRLFYIHSRWVDEAAFERHIGLPHTMRFTEEVEPLIDHPLEVTRTQQIEQ